MDHPRSRGVYCLRGRLRRGRRGSSPLARGLRLREQAGRLPDRIIPARAGFTCMLRENLTPSLGSSPLARGLPPHPGRRPRRQRIIPARAGFTPVYGPVVRLAGDHPRSRGVYPGDGAGADRYSGSSPLARGLRAPTAADNFPHRIIPARAGFTRRVLPGKASATDHPRSRGVYAPCQNAFVKMSGSSPLARGLHSSGASGGDLSGIIPARAGFTFGGYRRPACRQDHPRSRGVYRFDPALVGGLVGSSPLARSLRVPACRARGVRGIIPARAGFTRSRRSPPPRSGDHPRSRGVYPSTVCLT